MFNFHLSDEWPRAKEWTVITASLFKMKKKKKKLYFYKYILYQKTKSLHIDKIQKIILQIYQLTFFGGMIF